MIAVDGSSINLINTEEVINYYGTHDNQFSESPMARIVQSYDLLNEIIIFSNLYPINTSEKNCCKHHTSILRGQCNYF